MNQKTKKVVTLILLLLILISTLPINVFAKYINDMNSNAKFGVIAGSGRNYGHELHYAEYDGQQYIVFCTQYGVNSPDGRDYVFNQDFTLEKKGNKTEYEKIAEMIYFGYTMNYGTGIPTTTDAIKAACATQQYVWEYIRDNITGSYGAPTRNSWKAGYMSDAIYNEWLSKAQGASDNYYNRHVSFNETTGEIDIGDEVYYTDSNGVLANFDTFTKEINRVVFYHEKGSNQLKISVPIDCDVTTVTFDSNALGLHELMPNGQPYDASTMSDYSYFNFSNEGTQDLMFSNYARPIDFKVTFKIQSATLTITKQDKETGNKRQGDATFLNAEYEIYAQEDIFNRSNTKKYYSAGDLVATRKMDVNGRTEDVTKLPLGRYVVKEKVSSEGYLLDEQEYIMDLTKPDQVTNIATGTAASLEQVKKMQVHIFKSGIKENSGETPGLEGAEFTIKLNRQVEEAYAKGYSYLEVWGGIDEKGNSVQVDENRVREAQAIAPSFDVITTDAEGNAYTQNKLPYGKYITKETKTPKDYESASDFYFSITQDESEVEEVAKKVKDIVVNNEQMEAYIKLVKRDLDTNKIVSLNSATFEIKAFEDIFDRATGKKLYSKDEVITQKIGTSYYNKFTTNANGVIGTEGEYKTDTDEVGSVITPLKLPVGKYYINEINIPEGFLKLDKPVEFYVAGIRDYDQDKDEDFINEVDIRNEQPTGAITLDKTIALRDDVDKSLVDTSDLSGIKFKLTAKEDIIDYADGSIIYSAGQEVSTYNLSKDGQLQIQELPMGKYQLQEVETLEGLILDDTIYDIEFIKKDDVTKVYNFSLNIENKTSLVEISKTSITTGEELEGAKLTVTDKEGNIIDEWTSTKEPHKIEGLKIGETYNLNEKITPDGYVKSTSVEFTVENTAENQKVEMIDKVVKFTKKDVGGDEVEGAKITVTDEDGNTVDEWTSTKEPHNIENLEEGKEYTLHEETCPDKYVKATDVKFTVSEDKIIQDVEMIDKQLVVKKTDFVTGEEVEGAELTITDEEGNVIDKWTSSKEEHIVSGLEEGKTYTLTEETCPYGYEQAESIEFTVSEDKETQVVEMKDMPKLRNVRVEKIDEATKEHIKSNKFEFSIYQDEGCNNLIATVGANTDEGTALFNDLRYTFDGAYYIKETKAPTGYQLSDKVVKIEINDEGVFADGELLEGNDNIYSFVYYNSLLPAVQTGNEMNYALLIGAIALSLIGITTGIIIIKRKRK